MKKFKSLIRLTWLLLWVAHKSKYSTKVISLKHLKGSINTLRKVAALSRFNTTFPSDHGVKSLCFILGNGPSLTFDLKDNIDIFQSAETICVNHFVESDLYEKIKPKYYVLADPGYWLPNVSESFVSTRNVFFEQIINKTTWPLTIYVPFEAQGITSQFSLASNIDILFYNNVPLSGESTLTNILYDKNFGMPSAQNVLIPALFISLRLGHKKNILLGADHSWHKTLTLDDTNRVCVEFPHFYDNHSELVPFQMGEHSEKLFTMDSALYALALMFEGYWKLEEYSKYLGSKIYNASSTSCIDAFERKSIEAIQIELNNINQNSHYQ